MKQLILFILLSIFFITANAQLIIDAEYRPRFELRDGYETLKSENDDPAYFTTQRTRLNLNHTYNNLTSVLSIQDYRVWGESNIRSDDPGVSIYEAYFKIDLNEKWALTAGRQSFNLDNKRLFSSANWNQVGTSHDGFTVDFEKEKFNFKMLTAFNQTKVSNFGTDYSAQISNYKFLHVIWLEKKFENITLANLTITDAYQKVGTTNTDYYRFTTGAIIIFKKEANDIQFRGFYQTGKTQKGQDVNAYYTSASYARKLGSFFSLTAGFEYLSGNDYTDSNNTDDNAFDILYGSRHWMNGMMDYFSVPSTTKNAGLVDGYLILDVTKIKNWKLSTQYHYFALSNTYAHNNESQEKFLAHEIDFVSDWKVNDVINIQMGYGMLFGGQTLEYVQEVDPSGLQQFFFTMITVKPTFFNSK